MSKKLEKRKKDHLQLCEDDRVAFRNKTTLLEEVELVHCATTELSLKGVSTATSFAGADLSAPIWLGAMTGGTDGTKSLNRQLAAVAGELGIGFCLGSMKPMLRDPSRKSDFDVREAAGDALVMGNIGATELVSGGPKPILDAIQAIDANGIGVHLNPLMELVQPGGDTDFGGILEAIGNLVAEAPPEISVFVKETGCGLSWQDGVSLKQAGVEMVEVAGAGGTSWTGVEALRATDTDQRLGEQLWDWGIPTAVSTAWMVDHGFTVVASGGIRTALDVARSVALGASLAGVAAPLVMANKSGGMSAVRQFLEDLITGLRYVMVASNAADLDQLTRVPRVVGPRLSRWIETGWPQR